MNLWYLFLGILSVWLTLGAYPIAKLYYWVRMTKLGWAMLPVFWITWPLTMIGTSDWIRSAQWVAFVKKCMGPNWRQVGPGCYVSTYKRREDE